MSIRLKRLLVGVVAALPTVFLLPGEASAEICVNAVNVSGLGAANQTNTCTANLGVPGTPTLPVP
jgi:hypothetical protein